jgi:hypothetical protein
VLDQHPVAAEFPADSRAGGINCAGNPFTGRVLAHKRASFFRLSLYWTKRGTIRIISFDMGEKQFVFYPIPAVIIAVAELPLDGNKFAKAPAAFPATVALKLHHTTYLI